LSDPEVVAAWIALLGVVATAIVGYVKFHRTEARLNREFGDTEDRLKREFAKTEQRLDAELGLKARELEEIAQRLRSEQEGARQIQLTEVLKKRIETYPALYEVLMVYGRNWELEGKPRDHAWADAFLRALLDVNAKTGAFFSVRVYHWFVELRALLEELRQTLMDGGVASEAGIDRLYDVIRGPMKPSGDSREPGLGSFIKDELGSYVLAIVSAEHTYETSEVPASAESLTNGEGDRDSSDGETARPQ
jgi:hypothetical protein